MLNEGFGRDLAGRANTALNLMMFGGSFVAQWGIGVVVDAARARLRARRGGRRCASRSRSSLAGNVATYAWFVARLAAPTRACRARPRRACTS